MLNTIFRKLFRRKYELLVLGVIVFLTTIIGKVISVEHWITIDFDLSSYSPWAPIIAFIWAGAGILVLWIRKIRAPSLWFIFLSSLVYTFIMFWAIWLK